MRSTIGSHYGPAMPAHTIRDVELQYDIDGSGPTVIWGHGLTSRILYASLSGHLGYGLEHSPIHCPLQLSLLVISCMTVLSFSPLFNFIRVRFKMIVFIFLNQHI